MKVEIIYCDSGTIRSLMISSAAGDFFIREKVPACWTYDPFSPMKTLIDLSRELLDYEVGIQRSGLLILMMAKQY